ncbi:low-density lipoprotein receptor-related protein 11-like [Piliocolobus tephrosceles]|uniref:low-density lipoprotein receptor-related protein 11-like n=1 Tax=Piliocolobus tephrosceles TaxID=591936 RepID=UPI000E6B474E|nr:low-density lipoprotein receptor-related protein 11-like [Piliocolobus tephrosceles]
MEQGAAPVREAARQCCRGPALLGDSAQSPQLLARVLRPSLPCRSVCGARSQARARPRRNSRWPASAARPWFLPAPLPPHLPANRGRRLRPQPAQRGAPTVPWRAEGVLKRRQSGRRGPGGAERTVPGRAGYASRCCGSRRRLPRHRALRGLLLFCLWLPRDRLALPPATPLSELHAQSSGVEQLPEEFRQQPDDSLAADTSFLRAPLAVLGWRQCGAACCSEPRCCVAVVELPRRTAPLAAALGCYLFNCTARGRNICRPRQLLALHRGYGSYNPSRAPDGVAPSTARASLRLGKRVTEGPAEARAFGSRSALSNVEEKHTRAKLF